MKKRNLLFTLLVLWFATIARSQHAGTKDYRNFPIVFTLQFHSLSMPFKDMASHFKNIGFGIGTEVSLNGNHDWVQQFGIIRYRNKALGNGWLFSMQTAWRPYLNSPVYGEVKLGIGYMLASKPSTNWVQKEGKWITDGKKGKGMLAIPAGISIGYHDHQETTNYVSPFAGYQLVLLKGYNADLPIIPETFIQAGARFHPKW